MKKSILFLCTAFALIGCKQQGGTGDEYNTERSSTSSTNINAPASTPSTSQGGAGSQGGTSSGTGTSSTDTNKSSTPPTP